MGRMPLLPPPPPPPMDKLPGLDGKQEAEDRLLGADDDAAEEENAFDAAAKVSSGEEQSRL